VCARERYARAQDRLRLRQRWRRSSSSPYNFLYVEKPSVLSSSSSSSPPHRHSVTSNISTTPPLPELAPYTLLEHLFNPSADPVDRHFDFDRSSVFLLVSYFNEYSESRQSTRTHARAHVYWRLSTQKQPAGSFERGVFLIRYVSDGIPERTENAASDWTDGTVDGVRIVRGDKSTARAVRGTFQGMLRIANFIFNNLITKPPAYGVHIGFDATAYRYGRTVVRTELKGHQMFWFRKLLGPATAQLLYMCVCIRV
jgi:hypothetical protein